MIEAQVSKASQSSCAPPLLSVVVPVLNEQGNVAPLVTELHAALSSVCKFELVFVDDGSTDASLQTLLDLQRSTPVLRVISHSRRVGQSAALRTGILAARGTLIATLDGDGQNDPADIVRLLTAFRSHTGANRIMVTGHRISRRDSWARRHASTFANRIRRTLLHDDHPDAGCSLKLFERDLYLLLPYFDHMHRYLPALAKRENCMVAVMPVNHRPRTQGQSKYTNLTRLLVGIPDLLGVMWLMRRSPGAVECREPRR